MRDATDFGTSDLVDRFMSALRAVAPAGVLNRVELLGTSGAANARVRWTLGSSTLQLHLEVQLYSLMSALPRHRGGERGADVPVLVSPFLSRRAREELDAAGWSYWDATGNMSLSVQDPLVVVRRDGAVKDPNPQPVTAPTRLRSLKGQAASEVIVGLLANLGRAASVRDFARDHRLPVATVSRVFALLREENFLDPTGGGPLVVNDVLSLARRWADDYSFATTFTARRYFSILGPDRAAQRLQESGLTYAVTGVAAAQAWLGNRGIAAALPASELWLYATDVERVERIADLAPAPRDGTILVAKARFLDREHSWAQEDGTRTVTPWRIVGDLLSRNGREAAVGESLADALLDAGISGRKELRA